MVRDRTLNAMTSGGIRPCRSKRYDLRDYIIAYQGLSMMKSPHKHCPASIAILMIALIVTLSYSQLESKSAPAPVVPPSSASAPSPDPTAGAAPKEEKPLEYLRPRLTPADTFLRSILRSFASVTCSSHYPSVMERASMRSRTRLHRRQITSARTTARKSRILS